MLSPESILRYFVISWDNPQPANSKGMIRSLRRLGRLSSIYTKTSVLLDPKNGVTWRQVRQTIEGNLNTDKGNAFYVNIMSKKTFQIGPRTGYIWKPLHRRVQRP